MLAKYAFKRILRNPAVFALRLPMFFNLFEPRIDFFEIWIGKTITQYRKNLLNGKRCNSPCTECNAEGTVLGYKHADAWRKIYNIKS